MGETYFSKFLLSTACKTNPIRIKAKHLRFYLKTSALKSTFLNHQVSIYILEQDDVVDGVWEEEEKKR